MPNRQHFDSSGRRSDSIIQVIVNPSEMNASHASQADILSACTDSRLQSNKLKCAFQFLDECGGCFGSISRPPLHCRCDCARGAADYANRELIAQDFRIC